MAANTQSLALKRDTVDNTPAYGKNQTYGTVCLESRSMILKITAAAIFIILALLHSLLGEKEVLGPLFAQDWNIGVSRYAAKRLLRFAWHLTSIAWLGIAAVILGLPLVPTLAWMALMSGALVLICLPGHLAWPLFMLSAGCLWEAEGFWPGGAVIPECLVGLGIMVAALAALIHGYWAFGGQWGMEHVIPRSEDGRPLFSPGPLACLAVSALLTVWAIVLFMVSKGSPEWWQRWFLIASLVFLCLRAIGDGRQTGFSKSDRSTSFALYDDALFTPLVVLLSFSVLAALSLS